MLVVLVVVVDDAAVEEEDVVDDALEALDPVPLLDSPELFGFTLE